MMRGILKSGFFWRFVGGFAVGAIGIVTLHPGAVAHTVDHHQISTMAAGAR